jgi:hypothetical protein
MEPEWLRDPAVVGNIASLAKNREVKWTWKLPDGKQIGIRQTRIAWSRDFERWITMLGIDQRHLDIFISTNQLDWKALPELPPPYRVKGRGINTKGRKTYAERWAHFLTPEGLKPYGLKFEEVWLGKNMVWDFDNTDLSISFQDSYQVYNYLLDAGMHPTIVFSGRKGFHVWLNGDESAKMAGVHLHDLKDNDDPLRDLGRIYARVVADTTFAATGNSHPSLDLSPNYRQGLIRLPYSVNQQVVWPLSEDEINILIKNEFETDTDVGALLHPWEKKGLRYRAGNQCFRRMLDNFD